MPSRRIVASLAGACLLALAALPGSAHAQAPDRLPGTVVGITDGDTIVVELADGARDGSLGGLAWPGRQPSGPAPPHLMVPRSSRVATRFRPVCANGSWRW